MVEIVPEPAGYHVDTPAGLHERDKSVAGLASLRVYLRCLLPAALKVLISCQLSPRPCIIASNYKVKLIPVVILPLLQEAKKNAVSWFWGLQV